MSDFIRAGDVLLGPNGERRLVGDLNAIGGICDDCLSDAVRRDYESQSSRIALCDGWRIVASGRIAMTVEEARAIIYSDEGIDLVDFEPGWPTALVDGWFTADELEAIAVLMRAGEEI